jgi:hypothetical protein
MRYTIGLFKNDPRDIYVMIPRTAYGMSIHPCECNAKPNFHLPPKVESVVSRERQQLLYFTLLKAQIQISWEMLHLGKVCHKHYLVYMKVKSNEEVSRGDKFASFCTDDVKVKFWLELPGSVALELTTGLLCKLAFLHGLPI